MKAGEFLRLRKTCQAMNNFADQHQSLIGVPINSQIRFEEAWVSVNERSKRYSLPEGLRHFSGFSFEHVSFKLDFEAMVGSLYLFHISHPALVRRRETAPVTILEGTYLETGVSYSG